MFLCHFNLLTSFMQFWKCPSPWLEYCFKQQLGLLPFRFSIFTLSIFLLHECKNEGNNSRFASRFICFGVDNLSSGCYLFKKTGSGSWQCLLVACVVAPSQGCYTTQLYELSTAVWGIGDTRLPSKQRSEPRTSAFGAGTQPQFVVLSLAWMKC